MYLLDYSNRFVSVKNDLLSLADASRVLGVSVERVRRLVVAGDLPAQRFGNAWAVPRDAVIARQRYARHGGQPLSPSHAWAEIVGGDINLERPGRYQRRAEVIRCEMSNAAAGALHRLVGALEGGVAAAIAYDAALVASDERDIYLSRGGYERLDSMLAIAEDALGPIRLRVVDDGAWALIPGSEFAPRAAAALDLLDSADPRHWIAAEALIAND